MCLILLSQLEAMQNIAKASKNRSISELEKVVAEHTKHVSSDPIVKVGIIWAYVSI